jgi:hypothetical protein
MPGRCQLHKLLEEVGHARGAQNQFLQGRLIDTCIGVGW